jgi:ketosteroid isomerase-like protein
MAAADAARAADVGILRDGYAAFGRGDIPAVLAVDPDIEWVEPDGHPWGRTDRGHDDGPCGSAGTATRS